MQISKPIKNRIAPELLQAYKKFYTILSKAGHEPMLCKLDNETSTEVEGSINPTIQYVPPDNHAERATQTWKNHFPKDFPITQWCQRMEQAEITLNLLHPATPNSNKSAYELLYGEFKFNSTPLAPPKTHALVYLKPNWQSSWGLNAEPAFYVGPAVKHYPCYKVIMKNTGAEDTKHHPVKHNQAFRKT